MSSIEQSPTTSELNINGTISILIRLRNSEPIGFSQMVAISSPTMVPTINPATNAELYRRHVRSASEMILLWPARLACGW
jgi:hypothetical protein